ncbi:hypothetical protein [Nostoc sp. NMS4]|uniref:hypothetical protein n=1 Tax=Nostoc sp. NMS4 TaxID=2815390 RepID=UPI0025FDB1AB|nr:hypothetical protein [Nostoc sp. NMS4]MBN3926103.1 hypothetical protein [Nostoc sp. NMS4]
MIFTVGQLIEKLRQYPEHSLILVNDEEDREIDIKSVTCSPLFDHVLIDIVTPPIKTAEESTVVFDPIAC